MIDERYLANAAHCPGCATRLDDSGICPGCRLDLRGPEATRLWQVSLQAAELLAVRNQLLARLRAGAPSGAPDAAALTPTGVRSTARPPTTPPRPRAEWSRRRVQNLLLGLGVGLLALAAVIFLVVSWDRLGIGGRSAVMAGATGLAAAAAFAAEAKRLRQTAEALSLLTVGLALLDCLGARSADLAGARDVPGALYWAGAVALVALAAGLGGLVLPTRTLRLATALLAQLPVPLVAVHLAGTVDQPAAVLATGLAGQAMLGGATLAAWPRRWALDARALVIGGTAVAAVLAAAAAGVAAYLEDGSVVIGTAILLLVAGVLAVADRHPAVGRGWPRLSVPASVLAVIAVWAPVYDQTPDRWLPAALGAAALALLGAAAFLPADRRTGPSAVGLVAVLLPGLAALEPLATAVLGRIGWLDAPWTEPTGGSAVDLLARGVDLTSLSSGASGLDTTALPAGALLLCVAAALAVAARLIRPEPIAGAYAGLNSGALLAGAVALLLVAPALRVSFAVGLAIDLTAGLLLLLAAVGLARTDRTVGRTAVAAGTALLLMGLAWSLAVETATLVALPATALVVLVWATVARADRAWWFGGCVGATLAGVVEAMAVARHGGAGWPATHSIGLALLAATAVAAGVAVANHFCMITEGGVGGGVGVADGGGAEADPFWVRVQRVLMVVGAVAAVATAGAVTWWLGGSGADVGLAVAVSAAALVAAGELVPPSRWVRAADLQFAGAGLAALGVTQSAADPDRLWLALLAAGVSAAVLAVRREHRWGWLAAALLTASSWVRLADAEVAAPEAYTVPPALALLALGLWRRRRDAACHSWNAYGTALTLALVPSLLRAVTDTGNTRPLLLGLAALVVLAVGAWRRLQAPLVLGAVVLAVDALVQLAPHLVAAYDVVPRWASIGVVGLLLLAAGATYEQRVRDARRIGQGIARLG